MKREDCWMTFSEALEQYLDARDELRLARNKADRDFERIRMRQAAEHMDTWTDGADLL